MAAFPKCPACHGRLVRFLSFASEHTRGAYYSCHCGHLWGRHKELVHLTHHITRLLREATPRPWSRPRP